MTTQIGLFMLCLIIGQFYAITISNLTNQIKLSSYFIPTNATTVQYIWADDMTYFIDPNTKKEYLWYGMYAQIPLDANDSNINFVVKSDIFDDQFNQYNNTNLPFTLSTAMSKDATTNKNAMCTSPATNDIISCFDYFNKTVAYGDDIFCTIYFIRNNTFSDRIKINNQPIDFLLNYYLEVLCLNDSYLVAYVSSSFGNINGTLINLNGDIVLNNIDFNDSITTEDYIFSTKGSKFVNYIQQNINKFATDTFIINTQICQEDSNKCIYCGLFYYYTNIQDANPIQMYKNSTIYNTLFDSDEIANTAINVDEKCCYVCLYACAVSSTDYSSDVNAIIFDIYGNVILNELVLSKYNHIIDMRVMDLSVISDDDFHYFMICYSTYDTIQCFMYSMDNDYKLKNYGVQQMIHTHGPIVYSYAIYNLLNSNHFIFSMCVENMTTQNNNDLVVQTLLISN